MEIVGTRFVCALVLVLLLASAGDVASAQQLAALLADAGFILFLAAGAELQARRAS
jgi:hypothetical protein